MPPTGDTGDPVHPPRIGAYVLAADPTWLTASVRRYYDLVDVLLVVASADDTGWTGAPVAAGRCVELLRDDDPRGIVRVLLGHWVAPGDPMRAETAQRQAALDELRDVDWVLQLDGDEVLPSVEALTTVLRAADREGIGVVEWPMRVLYRRRRDGSYLEIANRDGSPHLEYPGPIAVRSGTRLSHARRTDAPFLRVVAEGDQLSTQVARAPEPGEHRHAGLPLSQVVVHNSWARSPRSVRAKLASWGHHSGWRTSAYFVTHWLPSRWTWRVLRDLHPLYPASWPRLTPTDVDVEALVARGDRR